MTRSIDDQTLKVYEGEATLARGNTMIGEYDLPRAQRGVAHINICFNVDFNGVLKIFARNTRTGKMTSLVSR